MTTRDDALINRIKYSDPQDQWEMIPSPFGGDPIPAWKASTMATGTMGAYDAFIKQAKVAAAVINDSLDLREQEVSAREDAVRAREGAVMDLIGRAAHMCDSINRRLDQEEQRQREELEEEPVEDPAGFNDEGELEPIAAKDPEEDPRTIPLPEDDEDAGEVLERAPIPPHAFMHERPMEIEDD
jgi:hypothetical protein